MGHFAHTPPTSYHPRLRHIVVSGTTSYTMIYFSPLPAFDKVLHENTDVSKRAGDINLKESILFISLFSRSFT